MHKPPVETEIKFAIRPADTTAAIAVLELAEPSNEEYTVRFFDTPIMALFEAGLILRCRQANSGGADDSTVKVRGVRAASAFERFGTTEDGTRKFEGDQNVGDQERESFSITYEPPSVFIGDVLCGSAALPRLFGADGRTLFEESHGVQWAQVTVFGPIQAKKWKLKLPGIDGKLTAELWQAGRVELLEISDKRPRERAPAFSNALAAFMKEKALTQLVGSKTLFALKNMLPLLMPGQLGG